MTFPRLITWSCPVEGCRKTHFTPIPADGMAALLCSLCGYTAMVKFFPAPPAEPLPTNPDDPKFQPF